MSEGWSDNIISLHVGAKVMTVEYLLHTGWMHNSEETAVCLPGCHPTRECQLDPCLGAPVPTASHSKGIISQQVSFIPAETKKNTKLFQVYNGAQSSGETGICLL